MGEIAGEKDVVIVGGGICGLATALALHKKGISSLVLEKSAMPRATGVAIIMQANGWRALDQLGVGSKLRDIYTRLRSGRCIFLDTGGKHRDDEEIRKGEFRCIKRCDLIKVLLDELPSNTVLFNSRIVAVELDPINSCPIVELHDGTVLRPKVLVGCDGVNSIVADFIGLQPVETLQHCVIRGFKDYPNGHSLGNEYAILTKDNARLGRFPMTEKQVYWFLTRKSSVREFLATKDPTHIRQATLEMLQHFPGDVRDLVQGSDLDHIYCTDIRHHTLWSLLFQGSPRKSTVVVAGDAMHTMAPFIAQGGAAALEDAILLARCLANSPLGADKNVDGMKNNRGDKGWKLLVEKALDQYIRGRFTRILKLSFSNYLHGLMIEHPSSLIGYVCGLILGVLFLDYGRLSDYDCGQL